MANLFTAKIATVNETSSRFKNLKIDDPVLYSLEGTNIYNVGHFAGFDEDGSPRVFYEGKTSITASTIAGSIKLNLKNGDVIMMIADEYLQ